MFHHNDCCCDSGCGNDCGGGCNSCGAPASGYRGEQGPAPKAAPKKMPSDKGTGGDGPSASLTIEPETKNPFELNRRYESSVEHAADYSSLTGQLFYVHADGGLWVLRYAPLWKEDPNGGSVVLTRELNMDGLHEGDLVTVHGEILSQRSSVFLGGPLYKATSIAKVEGGGQ
jgi:hypothetical protein